MTFVRNSLHSFTSNIWRYWSLWTFSCTQNIFQTCQHEFRKTRNKAKSSWSSFNVGSLEFYRRSSFTLLKNQLTLFDVTEVAGVTSLRMGEKEIEWFLRCRCDCFAV